MIRRLAACLLALPLLVAAQSRAAQKPIRIAYAYSDGNLPVTLQAYKALLAERPDLRGRVQLTFLTESMYADRTAAELTGSDVLVLDTMNQQMVDRFDADHKVNLLADIKKKGKVLAVGEGLLRKDHYVEIGTVWDDKARAYWEHSGFNNQLSLLKYALQQAGVTGLKIPDPEPSLDFGYYYPDGKTGRVFGKWEEFDAFRASKAKRKLGAPRVAIPFYKSSFYTGDTQLLDALVAEIERQGAEAIPLFGYPDAVSFSRQLTDADGKSRADVALALSFRFAGFDDSKSIAKLDIPVINLISLYGRTEKDWRESNQGLSQFEGTFQVAVPELAGLIAPTVVGSKEKIRDAETGLTEIVNKPIASQVTKAVSRGLRYAALRTKPNREKKLALLFYDYPAGKANIGASYLNVADSLANLLDRLAKDGYNVGTADRSSAAILKELSDKSRNVGGYAPGELDALVDQGAAIRVSAAQYRKWLQTLAPGFRAKLLKDWGPPEKSKLMAVDGKAGTDFIIPAVAYGNVLLMPQPARGWGEDNEKLYHAKDLAPHHQYVAAYQWLRNEYKADALIHVGTHGTLEWLDGKDIGLSDEDAPDALISDLPDLYIYNVDVVGEGLVARRRGMATLIDHMVPPFKQGGLYTGLAALGEAINDFDVNLHKNPELAQAVASKIRDQVIKLGIAKDLSLDLSKPENLDDPMVHRIQDHIVALKSENIPYGLHAFGRTPVKELRESTIDAIVSADRSLLPNNAKVLGEEMEQRIVTSGPRELDSMMRALSGGFVPAGGGGEPIRNPDSYATGNNFYGIDPDKVPKPASWDLGVKLADQMLAEHKKKHGKYPEKVSFVIWGDETMRHEGVLESQVFYLLGTKPVWNSRGKVVDVEVIPTAQLGRPRVDIVIACAAEGMFNNVTVLMDKAVQKVKALEEAENYVRKHYLATKAALIKKGVKEDLADRQAGVRIFDEPPGTFNLNTSTITAASGTWDSDKGMADEYTRKLGHGFGNGFWGEPMEEVFRLALSGTDTVVHSSSTMLYGALDNDDMFMYMGGLSAAIRNIDGKSPEMMVTNTRNPAKPEMTSMDKFIGTEFRSRYVNPNWIEGMKKEGYAGAGAMREFVEYLWGWKATTPELIDDAMWNETFETYVQDKNNLGMKDFFEKNSPYAYQDVTARMVETIRKGYWNADDATKKKLLTEYLESVNKHGVGCAEHTCGNPRLSKYVVEQARAMGIPVPSIEGFQRSMEKAIGQQISAAAKKVEQFVAKNEAPLSSRPAPAQQSSAAPRQRTATPSTPGGKLQGYLMEVTQRATQAARRQAAPASHDPTSSAIWISLGVLASLLGWRWLHHNAGAGPV